MQAKQKAGKKMHKYKQIRLQRLCVGMSGRVGEKSGGGGGGGERSELYYHLHAAPAAAG